MGACREGRGGEDEKSVCVHLFGAIVCSCQWCARLLKFCRARMCFASAMQPPGRCICLLVFICVWMLAERSDGGDNWARCLPSEEGCDEIVSSAIESAGEGSSNQLLRQEHAAVLAKAAQDSAGFLAEMLKESQVTPTC